MKITRMHKGSYGKVKAFFDVEVDGFTIKGFKIVEGTNGLFVSFPSQQNKDGDYNDTVWADKELKAELHSMALEVYESETTNQPTEEIPF